MCPNSHASAERKKERKKEKEEEETKIRETNKSEKKGK
jgi:hypothetical protein